MQTKENYRKLYSEILVSETKNRLCKCSTLLFSAEIGLPDIKFTSLQNVATT